MDQVGMKVLKFNLMLSYQSYSSNLNWIRVTYYWNDLDLFLLYDQ